MHTDLVRPSPLVHSLSPPSLHGPRRVRYNWRSKASTKTQAALGNMLLPLPVVIAIVLGAVVLAIALAGAIWYRARRRPTTPTTAIGGRHDDYATSEAGLVPPESQQALAATTPVEIPVQLQEIKHFHVAVLVSDGADWLNSRNLSVPEENTIMDLGCKYSIYINPLLMRKDENGDLVSPSQSDSKEIFAVKAGRVLAQIDGILLHEFVLSVGMGELLDGMDLPKIVMPMDPKISERYIWKWERVFVRNPWIYLPSLIENPEGTA